MFSCLFLLIGTQAATSCRLASAPSGPVVTSTAPAHARRTVEAVLSDVVARRYRYGADDRLAAFETIGRLRMVDLMPIAWDIAAMALVGDDATRYLDWVAVVGALNLLAAEGDVRAIELNVRRLRELTFRGSAVVNLTSLKAWEATPAIESELLAGDISATTARSAIYMLRFLVESPKRTPLACDAARKARAAHDEDCSGANAERKPYCAELLAAFLDLESLACQK